MINDMIQRKEIYTKALRALHAVNQIDNAFSDIGINLLYDDSSAIGISVSTLMSESQEIAFLALNVELRQEKGYIANNRDLQVTIETFYPESGNPDFSMTCDGMYELITQAAEDQELAGNVWKCFVDNDGDAKSWIQSKCPNVLGWPLTEKE